MAAPDAVEAAATTDGSTRRGGGGRGSRMEELHRGGVSRGTPTWALRLGDDDEKGQGQRGRIASRRRWWRGPVPWLVDRSQGESARAERDERSVRKRSGQSITDNNFHFFG